MKYLAILLLGAVTWAQPTPTQVNIKLSIDSTGATGDTKPFAMGTVLPASCGQGSMFFKSNAPAGQNVYGCTVTNTWTLQGGAGSGNVTGSSLTLNNVIVGAGGSAVVSSSKAAPSGQFVGDADTQTLTNKSIDGAEINSGTLPDARLSNTGVGAGSCGDTTHSCGLTYDAHGRLTVATNNVIAGGGGGGASSASALTDYLPSRTTGSVANDTLTWTMGAPLGDLSQGFTGTGTLKLSGTSNNGTVYCYFNRSSAQIICGNNTTTTLTVTGTNVSTASSIAAYPYGTVHLFTWTYTANVFDSSGYTDGRTWLNTTQIKAGNGIQVAADNTISQDTQTFVGTCRATAGTGSPAGVVTGSVCDEYWRTDGGASTTLYVKESGTATTSGWTAYGAGGGGGTIVERNRFKLGVCSASNGSTFIATDIDFDAGVGSATCVSNAIALVQMPSTGTPTFYMRFTYPSGVTALSVISQHIATVSSGNVKLNASIGCQADGTNPLSLPTQNSVSSASNVISASNQLITTTVNTLTLTGCSAGNLATVALSRDNTVGSNMAGFYDAVGPVTLLITRSLP